LSKSVQYFHILPCYFNTAMELEAYKVEEFFCIWKTSQYNSTEKFKNLLCMVLLLFLSQVTTWESCW